VQQDLAQFLVLGDRFGDGAGAVGFRRLNPPLPAAPAKLHHAAFGQPAVGDVARHCRIDDGPGARAQAHVLVEFAQTVERLVEFERPVVDRRLAEILREFEGQAANRLFAVFDDHLVGARFQGLRRAAESHRAAGLCLQAERANSSAWAIDTASS
jgi:hypothetical protein